MVLTAIPFSMVSASAAEATNISMSGMTYPSGTLNKGDLFVLRGTISANKNIQRIEIGIVKDGKWVAGHKVDQTVNAKNFNVLQKADSKIKFGDLAEGNYSYRCWVWIDGKSNKMFDKQFTVAAGVPKITLSGVSYPSGTLNKGDLFVLRGTISANKNIQRIEIGIVKDEQWVAGHKVDQKINAKSYNILQSADSKIKFGDLGEGVYKYRCWIWIDGKRYAGFDRQFAVTAGAPKITLSGVSYPSGTLNKGDLFVLRGTISANKNIQRIEIGIVKDGKWVAGHKVDQAVNAKSFNILQKADSKIKFGDLAEGNYSYRCWVWIDGKSNKVFDKQFAVATAKTGNDIVKYANSVVGKSKSQLGLGGEWCARFVSHCAKQSGNQSKIGTSVWVGEQARQTVNDKGGQITFVNKRAYNAHKNDFVSSRCTYNASYMPKAGDLYIQYSPDYYFAHVGIVRANSTKSYIAYTIEGNTSCDDGNHYDYKNVEKKTRNNRKFMSGYGFTAFVTPNY